MVGDTAGYACLGVINARGDGSEMREWLLRFWWPGSHPLDGPVHRGSSDPEEFGELSLGVATGVVQLQQVLGLIRLQLRLLATQPTLRLRNLHPFPGAHLDQVGFELCHHRQYVEQQPAHRVGRIMNRAAETELHVPPGQLVQDVASVRQRPSEPVQLRYYQGVTGSAGDQGQPQSGAVAVYAC